MNLDVVYPLSQSFVRQVRKDFDEKGYLIIEDALSSEQVADANSALDAMLLPKQGDLRPLVKHDPIFLDHVDHPRIFPYVLALIGGNVQLLGSSVTIIPPGAGSIVWHEDGPRPWSYPLAGGRRPLIFVRAGFYLEDLSAGDCGNLVVVAGSHRTPFDSHGDSSALWEHPDFVELRVRAGGAVIFHNGLWHSTSPNKRQCARRALYYVYSPCWHRIIDYVTPSEELLKSLETMDANRQKLFAQLLGVVPTSGAESYMFSTPEEQPGLSLVEPDNPASGA